MTACGTSDNQISWVAAIQAATGARIKEVSWLRVEDLRLDDEIPHILIREHEALGRTLKTDVSARAVPLVGLGLWGCRRALANPSGKDGWLFGYGGTTYPATQPMADWLMKVIPGTPKRSHSFRYAVETRLTYAGVAQSKIDAILGHESKTKSAIASGYFGGWKLEQLRDALQTIALPVPALQQN